MQASALTEGRVRLRLAGGEKLEADDVVLTAPPTTWSKIAFDPPLPGR